MQPMSLVSLRWKPKVTTGQQHHFHGGGTALASHSADIGVVTTGAALGEKFQTGSACQIRVQCEPPSARVDSYGHISAGMWANYVSFFVPDGEKRKIWFWVDG
jgi:hypothetical protein